MNLEPARNTLRYWFLAATRAQGEVKELRHKLGQQEIALCALEQRVATLKAAMREYEERLHNADG